MAFSETGSASAFTMFADEAQSGEQLQHGEASIELLRQSMYRREKRLEKRSDSDTSSKARWTGKIAEGAMGLRWLSSG